MKKFNEILNENNEGELNNSLAVDLIVKEHYYLKNTLFIIMKDAINKDVETIESVSEDSFESTVIKDPNGNYSLKYLAIQFRIDESVIKDLDLSRYFKSIKDNLNVYFKLRDDAIKTSAGWYLRFAIDYADFKNSNYYKSTKGISKYKL